MIHRILIVDDETHIQLGLRDFLTDETDFDITSVSSAEEGLERLTVFRPTVCIVDMRLPGMNGNDFIREAHQRLPGCGFIVHTGSLEYEPPADIARIGVTQRHVFQKPVTDMARFINLIRQFE